ncbi:VOC family protein [Herbiconiux sp. L3-i23]|uniref:VOC family protein n=1 Tax=Herbiconiux sp. L3-i23 TaxID=2905871 RepID=UPI002059DC03|nr:VOC family protein [Herbiconiux sp. L3-i23]BDI23764.1 hypothetical protein L3i23_25400 [Herbiconiux sp. L3-i23]
MTETSQRPIESNDQSDAPHVSQLRVVIEAPDFDAATAFYRDALGLDQLMGYRNANGAQLVLDVGRATIELVHPELDGSGALSDPPAPKVRLVFQTQDVKSTIAALEEGGAERLDKEEPSAGHSISARMIGPDHMPLAVFQSLSGPDFAVDPRHED